MYGGFTSNVDMKSGAPAFGTPEYAQAAQASGQLARLLNVPFRSSNVTAANDVDAQAAYESMMALWGCGHGRRQYDPACGGWLNGGLTASFEKLIIDAEMLQMMAAYCEPFAVTPETLALDAVRDVGPAGHYFGTAHTLARYRDGLLPADDFQLGQLRQLARARPRNGAAKANRHVEAAARGL